jgi:hypothetical protein
MSELEALLKRQGAALGEPRMSSLISFGPLEGVINAVVAQTNQMAAALAALEERTGDFLTREDGRKQDYKLMDLSNRQQGLLNRFDKNFLSIEHLMDDLPKRLAAYDQKLQYSEDMHTLELQKARNELMARLKLAETNIDQRAPMADFRALTREVSFFLPSPRTAAAAPRRGRRHLALHPPRFVGRVDLCSQSNSI